MAKNEKNNETFDGQAEELMAQLWKCKEILYDFNALRPSQLEKREAVIRQLFGRTGKHVFVNSPFSCDFGFNIEVGENFFINEGGRILDSAKVIFGDNAFIGPNCSFYTTKHPVDAQRRNNGEEAGAPITIGDNVWLGGNVVVLPGVTIGDNSVIAGGSVVTKDIPSNVVAGGYPCKVIRPITEEDKTRPL